VNDAAPQKRSFLKRWSRRAFKGAILLVVLLVVLRMSLPFVLPVALDKIAGHFGLHAEYEALKLRASDGSFELWGLRIGPRGEGETLPLPFLTVDYAAADLELRSVLSGRPRVRRASADGVRLFLDRKPSGEWALLETLAPLLEGSEESEPEPEEELEGGIPLSLPFELGALRVNDAAVVLDDRFLSPRLTCTLSGDLSVTDLGSPEGPARIEAHGRGAGLFDEAIFEGDATIGDAGISAVFGFELNGLRPKFLTEYLVSLGIEPIAEDLEVRGTWRTEVAHTDETREAIGAELRFEELAFEVDLQEHFAVDGVVIEIGSLSGAGCTVSRIEVDGVRGQAQRTEEGRIRVAGFELGSPPPSATAEPAATEEPEVAETETEPRTPPTLPFPLELREIEVGACSFHFDDRAMTPPVELELTLEASQVLNVILDPARPDERATFGAKLHLPGIVETVAFTAEAGASWPKFDVALLAHAEGIAPERLTPYLDALGIESTWDSGQFMAQLSAEVELTEAGLRAEAAVTDLVLWDEDESSPFLGIQRMSARGIELAPAEARYVLGELELSGTRFDASRDADRAFHAMGLRIGGRSEHAAAPPESEPETASSAEAAPPPDVAGTEPPTLPHLEITSIHWRDTQVTFLDEALEERPVFVLDDLEARMHTLIVGGDEAGGPRPPASFELSASMGELASSIEVDGELISHPGRIDVDGKLHFEAAGLTFRALSTYLEAVVFEPTLENGRLTFDLELGIEQGANGFEGGLALHDVELAQGDSPLATLGRFEVRELAFDPQRIRIGAIEISEPYLAVELDDEGALRTFGVRVMPRTPPEGGEKRLPRLHELVDLHALEEAFRSIALGEGPRLELTSFRVDDLELAWADGRVNPRVETELGLSFELDDLLLGAEEDEATYDARLSVAGSVEELHASGRFLAAPRHFTAVTAIEGRGLRVGPLKSYLPPGLESTLEDGRLRLKIEGELIEEEDGDFVSHVETSDFDYREADAERPFLAFTRIAASTPRIDAESHDLRFDKIECVGLQSALRRASATRWEAMGIAIDTEVLASQAAEAGAAVEAKEASAPVTPGPAASRSTIRPPRLPRIAIEELGLELSSLHLEDSTRPAAAPVDLGLWLRSDGPLVLLDEHPEELEPIELSIGGAVRPLIGEFTVDVNVEPFVPDPRLRLNGKMSGLRGEALTELAPRLAELVDGSGLEDGEATGSLDLTLHARRHGALGFDWSTGFGLEADLGECVLRDGPGGEELLGLGGLLVDVRRVRPRTGAVHIAEIDIIEPRGTATRIEEGIRVAGLLVKTPKAVEVEPGEAKRAAEPAPVEADPREGAPTEVAGEPEPVRDLRIDRFYVSGLDLNLGDEVVEPPLLVPLADVDLAVTGLSTLAIEEGRPVRLRTVVSAGDVRIPARDSTGNLITLPGDQESEWPLGAYAVEERPAFDELSFVGEFAVKPELRGHAKLQLWGLELLGAAGEAREFGIEIHDGVLDSTIEMHLNADRGLSVDALSTFTWLSISEGDDGPIASTLSLPAPLDAVIFMTRNSSGENRIPVSFTIPAEGLDGVGIAAAATSTVTQVIAASIARSPFRVLGGALDLGGLLSGDPVPRVKESVVFEFQPGTARLNPGEFEKLGPLVEMLERDSSLELVIQHHLGSGDHEKAEKLANPDPATCREYAEGLRRNKAELLRERDLLAAEVRAMYALEALDRAEGLSIDLRNLDARLGGIEQALDQLYGFLRPGAERRRDRRTKSACLTLARQRLGAAREVLHDLELVGIRERIDIRRPRFILPEEDDGRGGTIVITPVKR